MPYCFSFRERRSGKLGCWGSGSRRRQERRQLDEAMGSRLLHDSWWHSDRCPQFKRIGTVSLWDFTATPPRQMATSRRYELWRTAVQFVDLPQRRGTPRSNSTKMDDDMSAHERSQMAAILRVACVIGRTVCFGRSNHHSAISRKLCYSVVVFQCPKLAAGAYAGGFVRSRYNAKLNRNKRLVKTYLISQLNGVRHDRWNVNLYR